MKLIVVSICVAAIAIFGSLGVIIVNLLVHDESISEAIHNAPQQLVHSFGDLCLLAWEYKFVTFVAVAIVITILLIRRVPEVRNQ